MNYILIKELLHIRKSQNSPLDSSSVSFRLFSSQYIHLDSGCMDLHLMEKTYCNNTVTVTLKIWKLSVNMDI